MDTFGHLETNFENRLGMWKIKHVNQPGRTVLIQSVLGTLASHHLSVFPMPKRLTDRLDSIQRKFFWNKKGNNRGLYYLGWDNVTKPIVHGGLNIKKTEYLNTALLAKLAWRMLKEPDALWAQILKHKNFPNHNPLHYVNDKAGSWVWRGICRGLEVIRENYCWEVGNGKNISIWKDKWVPGKPVLLNSHFASANITTVDQLIDQNGKEWNVSMLSAIFDAETVSDICRIRLPLHAVDELRWTPSYNGEFSVKTAYRAVTDRIFGPVQDNFNWKLKLPPKIKHFLWKCVNNCLPIRGKIGRYVHDVDQNCPLCSNHVEAVDHLLLECHVTISLYNAVNSVFTGMYNGMNIKEWIATWCDNSANNRHINPDFISSAGFMLWHAWKLRCALVFDNVQVQVEVFRRQVEQSLSDWNSVCRQQISNVPNGAQSIRVRNWSLPGTSFTKINFDGSYLKENNTMGCGLIAFTAAGSCVGATIIKGVAYDEEQTEAIAAYEGIKMGLMQRVSKLHLEGDNLNVINARVGSVKWTTNGIISDCKHLLSSYDSWVCTHISRDQNGVADHLAKKARNGRLVRESWNGNTLPSELVSLIREKQYVTSV